MRSVSSITFQKGSAIASIEDVMHRHPLPPKKGAKKEDKKAAVVTEKKLPEVETNE